MKDFTVCGGKICTAGGGKSATYLPPPPELAYVLYTLAQHVHTPLVSFTHSKAKTAYRNRWCSTLSAVALMKTRVEFNACPKEMADMSACLGTALTSKVEVCLSYA